MKAMASPLDHFLQEMCESIAAVERTEAMYSAVVEAHHERFGNNVIADQKAAAHPDVQQAIGDGAWYRSRAQTYALGAIALMLHEQRRAK